VCPLCGHAHADRSWVGSARFEDRDYEYVECGSCGSLYCDPMPDGPTLQRMYGPDYEESRRVYGDGEPDGDRRVLSWLATRPRGVFVDYGCGSGRLLSAARKLGWTVVGVELDSDVARAAAERSGARVVSNPQALGKAFGDVLHLGDVIEHLTRLDEQGPAMLTLLKRGGRLLAQGPLEGNGNLFQGVVRAFRRIRGRRSIEMPPYHVLMATASGQRRLFERLGLTEEAYLISEVAWPAPERIQWGDLLSPAAVGLRALRFVSQGVSRLQPHRWGNRYFYVGRFGSGESVE